MSWLPDLILLRPLWLLALPAAVLLGALLWRRSGGLGAWERAADPALIAAMRGLGRVTEAGRSRSLATAALIALGGLALTGPAAERRDAPTFRNLDGVVIVLDISRSVAGDARFRDIQAAARLAAAGAGTRRTALVVFAGEAWRASAFTTDGAALGGAISLIAPDTAPAPGSRPEEGLRLARQMLDEAEIVAADVVLIGDGGGLGAEATTEAGLLAARGAPVSTIFTGSSGGAGAMAALAAAGGGAAGDLVDPFPVADRIAAGPARRLAETGFSAAVATDYGRWLLLAALVPAFLMLPRRGPA